MPYNFGLRVLQQLEMLMESNRVDTVACSTYGIRRITIQSRPVWFQHLVPVFVPPALCNVFSDGAELQQQPLVAPRGCGEQTSAPFANHSRRRCNCQSDRGGMPLAASVQCFPLDSAFGSLAFGSRTGGILTTMEEFLPLGCRVAS